MTNKKSKKWIKCENSTSLKSSKEKTNWWSWRKKSLEVPHLKMMTSVLASPFPIILIKSNKTFNKTSGSTQNTKIQKKGSQATLYPNLSKCTSWKAKTTGIKQLLHLAKKPFRSIHKLTICQKYQNLSLYL